MTNPKPTLAERVEKLEEWVVVTQPLVGVPQWALGIDFLAQRYWNRKTVGVLLALLAGVWAIVNGVPVVPGV